ncbi:MAG: GDP-mannose 4,6-dehydratase, partial [Chloroflexi bacterium]|nr:GDP-mannose 4,6-dehydratase [Chloroflexota bacterium]
ERFYRPAEVDLLIADASKAGRELGWEPKIGVEEGVNKLFAWVKANRKLF